MVSTFGKFGDSGEYVFFAADAHRPNYELIGNVVDSLDYALRARAPYMPPNGHQQPTSPSAAPASLKL